jgi:hypothetical protein
MGWLVWEKLLPPLLVGDPPNYRSISDSRHFEEPVGWRLFLNGRPVGSAVGMAVKLPGDETEVRSRVHFGGIRLEDLPSWLRAMVTRLVAPQIERVVMDCESTLTIDAEGRLSSFRSTLHVPPFQDIVRLRGTLNAGQLKLTIHVGDFAYSAEPSLPSNSLAGDTLSPQACLPGLHDGQTWTVPSYSPWRPPNNPIEILKASVEGTDWMNWNGRLENTWRVLYRSDPGLGAGSDQTPRGRLWVRPDGTVLRQEIMMFDCTLTFVRLSGNEAAALEKGLHER